MSGTSSQKYRSKRKQLRKLGNQNLRRNATSPSISSDFQQNKIRYLSFSSLNKKLKRIQITYKKKWIDPFKNEQQHLQASSNTYSELQEVSLTYGESMTLLSRHRPSRNQEDLTILNDWENLTRKRVSKTGGSFYQGFPTSTQQASRVEDENEEQKMWLSRMLRPSKKQRILLKQRWMQVGNRSWTKEGSNIFKPKN